MALITLERHYEIVTSIQAYLRHTLITLVDTNGQHFMQLNSALNHNMK